MSKEHKKKNIKTIWQKIWYFIWEDDSVLSWIVNVVIAFILIKFIIYPGLGLLLGTTHPVVAVVSGSMEHKITNDGNSQLNMCGKFYQEKEKVNFDYFWTECGDFYKELNINKLEFQEFPFKNGFNTGDIIVLLGKKPEDIEIGDVIVFRANQPDPIIHRVVRIWQNEFTGEYHFQTKGDHNAVSILSSKINEYDVTETQLIGKAVFKIPYLGNIKIWFVDLLRLLKLDRSVGRLFN